MVAFHALGRREQQPWLLEKASGLYPNVLRSFATTIADETASRSMVTLMVCVLLGFYEMIIASAELKSGKLSSHGAHARGVMGILHTGNKAYEILQRGHASKLENPLRIEETQPTGSHPNSLNMQLTCKSNDFASADLLAKQTWELLLRVEASLASPSTTTNELRRLLDEALQLKEASDKWPMKQPPQWHPNVIGTMGKTDTTQVKHPLCYPGNVESYHDRELFWALQHSFMCIIASNATGCTQFMSPQSIICTVKAAC